MKKLLKALARRMIPSIVDMLQDYMKKWVDDPATDTDDKAVEAVGDFIEYVLNSKLD